MSKFKTPAFDIKPGDSDDGKNDTKQQQEEKDGDSAEVIFDWSGARVTKRIPNSGRDRQNSILPWCPWHLTLRSCIMGSVRRRAMKERLSRRCRV